jgi:methionyl-tRNA formyltransferase
MGDLRIVFMGTAGLSCPSLAALAKTPGFLVAGVVTQPDKPKGRDLKLQFSPVKEQALTLGLPIVQPARARDETFIAALEGFSPDLIVVVAYGQILPQRILDLPRHGCINVHTSLLPKYRGAAPIQWAILNGDRRTGVTIMKMDAGLDTGDILSQEEVEILPEDTSETIHDQLAQIGAALLVRTIHGYVKGEIHPRPQPSEGSSYAPKIRKEDGRIIWAMPACAILNRLRGLTPWPGLFTHMEQGQGQVLLKIWEAQIVEGGGVPGIIASADKSGILVGCGEQSLRLLVIQKEGGKRLTAQQFLAGHSLHPGQKLG